MRRVVLAFAVLTLVGCGGGPRVIVHGRLQADGEPYRPGKNEQVVVTLRPLTADGKIGDATYPAAVSAEGSFIVLAPNREGIPPGRYKLLVTSVPFAPSAQSPMTDRFKGAYDVEHSPLEYDISPGMPEIVADVRVPR